MTIVLDPDQPLPGWTQLEGGTTAFMAPELLVPRKYGFTASVPTQKSDIYAFGLVINQVRDQDRGIYCVLTSFRSSQVRFISRAFAWGK